LFYPQHTYIGCSKRSCYIKSYMCHFFRSQFTYNCDQSTSHDNVLINVQWWRWVFYDVFIGVLSTSFIIILSLILWEIMFLIYLENKLLNYLLHVYFFFFFLFILQIVYAWLSTRIDCTSFPSLVSRTSYPLLIFTPYLTGWWRKRLQ
jgi:hypothetical protein